MEVIERWRETRTTASIVGVQIHRILHMETGSVPVILLKGIFIQKARDRHCGFLYKETLGKCSISQNPSVYKRTGRKFHSPQRLQTSFIRAPWGLQRCSRPFKKIATLARP